MIARTVTPLEERIHAVAEATEETPSSSISLITSEVVKVVKFAHTYLHQKNSNRLHQDASLVERYHKRKRAHRLVLAEPFLQLLLHTNALFPLQNLFPFAYSLPKLQGLPLMLTQ